MSRLPSCRPADVARVLLKVGFVELMGRGSHRTYFRERDQKALTIPFHSKDLKRGTLSGIIKQAGMTTDQFIEML